MKLSQAGEKKVSKVMKEWKAKKLHSGSKYGPVVKSRAQEIAIGISEGKRQASSRR